VRGPTDSDTYVVLVTHTSAAAITTDITAGRLELEIDGTAIAAAATLNVFPPSPGRNNRLLGFDASGQTVTYSRDLTDLNLIPLNHASARQINFITGQEANPLYFSGVGDGVADDTAALAAAASLAASSGRVLRIPRGTWRITDTITIGGSFLGIVADGVVRYAGPNARTALVIGDGSTTRNASRFIENLRVERATVTDWLNEADIGVLLRNFDASRIEIAQAEGFTIGVRTLGDGRGFEDSTIILGRIANNKIGLDIRTNLVGSWNNAVKYIGGHFANASNTNPTLDRYGVRFSREAGGYNLHNHHVFYGPAFELQNQGGAVEAIPFLSEVSSRSVVAYGMRIEGNSPQVHKQTGGAQDHVYEIAFSSNGAITGTEGNAYLLEASYPAGASRAGATIIPYHQAAAAAHTNKLIAGEGSLRNRLFAWTASERGLEGMAILASAPSGPPTTLAGLAFPGLSGIDASGDRITFNSTRAIGYVVQTEVCKEFLLAFQGVAVRPTIMLFDAAENVLNNTHVPLLSNQSLAWNASAQWWQATADSQDATYTRLQRVTLPATAVVAVIALGTATSAQVGSFRLYTGAAHSPPVFAGGTRRWGTRELTAVAAAIDPPSIASGGTHNFNVTLTDCRPGDFVQASFRAATTLPFLAQAQTDAVNVRIWNPTGAAVDLGANDVIVRAIKPRV
jgi:hypothetical protein